MTDKKNALTEGQSTKNNLIKQSHNNTDQTSNVESLSTEAQRARVLAHLLLSQTLTTLYARHSLNVMHPAARVMELRQAGHKIITLRRKDTDTAGRSHSVAEYVLMSGGGV